MKVPLLHALELWTVLMRITVSDETKKAPKPFETTKVPL